MTFYPQLSTGAMAQLPIRRRHVLRTVANVLVGGGEIRYHDP